jgi:hypothetical protein
MSKKVNIHYVAHRLDRHSIHVSIYYNTSIINERVGVGKGVTNRELTLKHPHQSPAGHPYLTLPYPTLQGRVGLGYETVG